MNVSTLQSTSAISALSPVQQSSVAEVSATPQADAASATVSKPGELMSKLQQLQQQDPAKLKEVAAQLSKDLKTAANNATGADADRLNKLADGLDKVASTGDVSSMQPQKKGGAHGHHHHHGGGAPPAQSSDVQAALSSAIDTVSQALSASSSSSASTTASAVTSTVASSATTLTL